MESIEAEIGTLESIFCEDLTRLEPVRLFLTYFCTLVVVNSMFERRFGDSLPFKSLYRQSLAELVLATSE
jgi:hypothetical protein